MTYAQLVTFIVTWIKENHNREITGSILQDVLLQLSAYVKDSDDSIDLDIENLQEQIDYITINAGVRRFLGVEDPNITPPTDVYDAGDLYVNTSNDRVYIFTGSEWFYLNRESAVNAIVREIAIDEELTKSEVIDYLNDMPPFQKMPNDTIVVSENSGNKYLLIGVGSGFMGAGGIQVAENNLIDFGITPDPFDPSNYDLDDFQNGSADPFVRESEVPTPTLQGLDSVLDVENNSPKSFYIGTKPSPGGLQFPPEYTEITSGSVHIVEGEDFTTITKESIDITRGLTNGVRIGFISGYGESFQVYTDQGHNKTTYRGNGIVFSEFFEDDRGLLFPSLPESTFETIATREWAIRQNNFTTQTIDSGGNYNDLEVTADLLIFTNENAQAILNGVWGRKEFHILNLSETYGLRINHDSTSVTDPNKRIKLPTAGGSVDIKGTARVLQTDDYGYFVADTWASKYRPEFTGLTETEVITVDPNSNADTMPMRELYVYRDAQNTPMTDAELNIAYPNATRPFQVVCSQLNVIYLKENDVTNMWKAIPLVQNDFPKLHSIKKTFTGAEVENWDTAPLELIPPVGAGYCIDVISAHHMAYNGTSFSEDLEIRYSDVITDNFYWSMLGIGSSSIYNLVSEFKETSGHLKSIGAGLVLTGSGGVVMDGELDVYITYQIIKL